MKVALFYLSISGFTLASSNVGAATLCFDFNGKVTKPIPEPIGRLESKDATRSGEFPSERVWGAARGTVAKPIKDVFKKLLDPNTVKNPETQKLEIEVIERPHFYAFRRVKVTINPFLFFTASWTEEWAYDIREGGFENPKSVLILYQKTEGTSHIGHLCGSIWLREINENATDVSLYEEVNATRRSAEDTVNGHMGTLRALR